MRLKKCSLPASSRSKTKIPAMAGLVDCVPGLSDRETNNTMLVVSMKKKLQLIACWLPTKDTMSRIQVESETPKTGCKQLKLQAGILRTSSVSALTKTRGTHGLVTYSVRYRLVKSQVLSTCRLIAKSQLCKWKRRRCMIKYKWSHFWPLTEDLKRPTRIVRDQESAIWVSTGNQTTKPITTNLKSILR